MPQITNKKVLPYRIEKLYEIITDVERYPEFIPWFKKITIISSQGNIITDVTVEFMFIRDTYTCTTELQAPSEVDSEVNASVIVTMVDGPFDHFITIWSLKKIGDKKTLVQFKCDFLFNNILYDKMAAVVLKSMNEKIINAFIKRASSV